MDIATVAGLLMAFAMMAGSLLVMGMEGKGSVNYAAFIDPPAIMMVIGGGIGVGLVGFPLRNVLGLAESHSQSVFQQAGKSRSSDRATGRTGGDGPPRRTAGVGKQSRADRRSLHRPGNSNGRRRHSARGDRRGDANRNFVDVRPAREQKKILELIGRCGPAFGMIATLLGLVLMLGNLSDPDSIGPSMAVALIGTLYGALMANLVCIPFTEKLAAAKPRGSDGQGNHVCAASWPFNPATIRAPCSKNSTPICLRSSDQEPKRRLKSTRTSVIGRSHVRTRTTA